MGEEGSEDVCEKCGAEGNCPAAGGRQAKKRGDRENQDPKSTIL